MKKRLVFLVSGGGTNMQAVLDEIDSGNINAEALEVISSNAEAYALTRAEKAGIPSKVFAKADYGSFEERDAALKAELDRLNPDYILLVGYLGILSPQITEKYFNRIINIHPSLLPKHGGRGFHGLAVHRAVLAAGDSVTGATVHFVDSGTDTGKIIRQKSTAVLEGDTPETLQKRVLEECEHPLLIGVVKDLCEDKIRP